MKSTEKILAGLLGFLFLFILSLPSPANAMPPWLTKAIKIALADVEGGIEGYGT